MCACVCVYVCTGGVLYSLWCHLRKVLGPVKLSEWMECFFRRPRSTFFHRGTSVCLFLFQIHSIIPDCSKHSRTFQEPHIPFSTPARITTYHPPLTLTPAPTQISSFFFLSIIPHHRWTWPKKRPSLSLLAPCRGIRVTLDEGKPSYFKHTWLVLCAVIKKKKKVSERKQTQSSSCGRGGTEKAATSYLSAMIGLMMRSWASQTHLITQVHGAYSALSGLPHS